MRRHRVRGFTLVECLLASALLTFVVAAMCQAIVAGQMHTANALEELRAMALAEALMEEVLSKPYSDPEDTTVLGPEAGETGRSLFDNADDYDGFTEDAAALTDVAGELYPDAYQRFSRAVSCAYTSSALSGLTGSADGLEITVTVTNTGGRVWTLIRFLPEPN